MSKKALLTGSNGFIGKNLSSELQKEYEVIGVDLSGDISVDLRNWNEVKKIPSVDIVFHLAALMDVPLSFQKPREIYETNVLSILDILEFCRQKKVKKVILASSYVYGVPRYLPINENHPTDISNPYMHSKLIGEELCKYYHKWYGLKCIILRVFNVYGPGQKGNLLIPTILRQLPSGIITLKNPKPKRDYLYVSDVVSAYIKAAGYNTESYEIFNIGYGESYSVKEIVDNILVAYGKEVEVRYMNEVRKGEIMNTIANINKAKKYLGWYPKVELKDGLKKTLARSDKCDGEEK